MDKETKKTVTIIAAIWLALFSLVIFNEYFSQHAQCVRAMVNDKTDEADAHLLCQRIK